MHKVDVPINFRPNVTFFFRKDRKRWIVEYDLPHSKKPRMLLTLPSGTTERQVKRVSSEKSADLIQGMLTEKEYKKYSSLSQGVSIAKGLKEYLSLTSVNKSERIRNEDRTHVPRSFSYFMSKESFKEAKELIEGKEKDLNPRRFCYQHMKEKAMEEGLRDIGFSFTHFSQIKEEHILNYRGYLLSEVEKRKSFEKELRPRFQVANSEEKKQLERERKSHGMAPTTAKGNLKTVFKVFKALKENKVIKEDPCVEVPSIKLTERDAVRSTTITQDQITQIIKADFKPDKRTDFRMKEFFLFLRKTGAREGEGLHLEWADIVNGVWKIRHKPNCPTKFGIGWSPKWNKERDVILSPLALRILELLPRSKNVGYVANDPTPYPAQFIFTSKDRRRGAPKGQRCRIDRIEKTWKKLLEAAELPSLGFDKLILHDLRRTKNVENQHVKGMGLDELCKQLGHSAKVNQSNYRGQVDPKILEIRAEISRLEAKIQEYSGESDLVSFLSSN